MPVEKLRGYLVGAVFAIASVGGARLLVEGRSAAKDITPSTATTIFDASHLPTQKTLAILTPQVTSADTLPIEPQPFIPANPKPLKSFLTGESEPSAGFVKLTVMFDSFHDKFGNPYFIFKLLADNTLSEILVNLADGEEVGKDGMSADQQLADTLRKGDIVELDLPVLPESQSESRFISFATSPDGLALLPGQAEHLYASILAGNTDVLTGQDTTFLSAFSDGIRIVSSADNSNSANIG